MWQDILKNIQIGRQKTSSDNYISPEEEDEDCFLYFYDLIKLLHPSFNLKRLVHSENVQGEDYWCRVKDTPWENLSQNRGDNQYNYYKFGHGVIEHPYSEMVLLHVDNLLECFIRITFPEAVDYTAQAFTISYTENSSVNRLGGKFEVVEKSKIREIWKQIQSHMEAK